MRLLLTLFCVCIAAAGTASAAAATKHERPKAGSRHAGAAICGECHKPELEEWRGSHHDLAMQVADASTVLGDFGDATFVQFGVSSRFFKRGDRFFVRTEGADGQLADFEIRYTFGATPLQQYLIEFPDGRLQALGIAWDSHPEEQGGQRWFHLYPDEKIGHDDPLHWTGPNQNWNFMCAECHSTALKKDFRPEEDRYQTTWAEIDVACEACHGPGAEHVVWAEAKAKAEKEGTPFEGDVGMGLAVRLGKPAAVKWVIDPKTGTAIPKRSWDQALEIETCARCHSRRAVIAEDYVHGRPLMDTHRPALLEERLYHLDGQIKDEVYVYGSFVQSRMYHVWVSCSHCHEPHSLALRAQGNALCGRCHLPERFDDPAHHFHKPDSTGSVCVECHMPATPYMVVDPRRDHSIRIPRPDLSVKLGTSDACSGCHDDHPPEWSAEAVARWYGPERRREAHFGETLWAARSGRADAETALATLADDTTQPGIARATALSLLSGRLSFDSLPTVERSLHDDDAMVRLAALRLLEALPPEDRLPRAVRLLQDPVRAVRIEAARVLVSTPAETLGASQRAAFESALLEYRAAQRANAERPESQLNLALLYLDRGEVKRAEEAYRSALKIDGTFVPAYVNLADLYRLQGRDTEGEAVLREAVAIAPENAALHHSLGLLWIRQKRLSEAVESLERATRLAPDAPRYSYVYALALQSTDRSDQAMAELARAHDLHPAYLDIVVALATLHRDRGEVEPALTYARKWQQLAPRDPRAMQLMAELERRGRRPK
jgi:Tfp pilus assembly protein PilF